MSRATRATPVSYSRIVTLKLPKARTWKELGFKNTPETSVQVEKGTDLFERLPDERKRQMLGPAKLAACQNGKLKLEDVIGFRRDKKWGPVGYERSLRDILGEKEGRKWKQQAMAMSKGPKLSDNATDRLIRELIRTGRAPVAEEIEQITDRMIRASFPSLETHLAKRIRNEQWAC